MQWALDISREHWLSRIDEKTESDYFWVVRSHHVTYKKQAFEGDELLIRTYVKNINGPFSERIVDILRGDQLIVEVESNWCFLTKETQKIKRVPEEIQRLFK